MQFDGPVSQKAPFLWHGGDYNPEQWPPAVWQDDFSLMRKAGISVVTVGVFSWVSLQPAEGQFTFGWLDEVMDGLHENGIRVILATPSAAQPAWMSQAYPDMLRSDERGVRRLHEGRTNYCPNSEDYRRLSGNMARALAERYGQHPTLLLWHVSNEYAGRCLCDTCAARFRDWLREKYGTLDELNARWWTAFWSHTFTDWLQIMPPRANGEMHMHGLTIDYFRFNTESQLACFRNERDILRSITPDIPITTNLMGGYKPLDYRRFAVEMDVVSWDCYPRPGQAPGEIAFMHDMMRGLKDGQPFLLMEQTPSSQNWQAVNALKRPGILRLWSYQAVAHGAESVLYFQWRRGRGGCEKLHGAVVEHSGRDDTRVFREVSQLGAELAALGNATLGARTEARVGILFDWDNWNALEDAVGPIRDKCYYETVCKHYLAFFRKHLPVDVIFPDSDLSQYAVIVAPMLYMVKAGCAEKVEAFVQQGGTFVATCFSGRVDETDLAFEDGYPGPLRRMLGLWLEETDALYEGQTNRIVYADGSGDYSCSRLADLLHVESAEVVATFGSDFYAGLPALTKNVLGTGTAFYLASDPDEPFLDRFYDEIAGKHGLIAPLNAPEGVEIAVRYKDGRPILFLLNHNRESVAVELGGRRFRNLLNGQAVSGQWALGAYDVGILVEQGE